MYKDEYIDKYSKILGISSERFSDPKELEGESFIFFKDCKIRCYYISNFGRIKSVGKSNREESIYTARFSNSYKTRDYPFFAVYTKTIRCISSFHRLVAIAFIPNPENKRCVNHKNGNKLDCRVVNLEWATFSENNFHAIKNGLKISPSGIKQGQARPIMQLTEDGKLINIFTSQLEASTKVGVHHQSFSQVFKKGKNMVGGFFWQRISKEDFLELKEVLSLI